MHIDAKFESEKALKSYVKRKNMVQSLYKSAYRCKI